MSFPRLRGEASLLTSFLLMMFVQTIGSVDMPGKGARKMPSPRQYVAIVVAWLVLMIAAGISGAAARGAAALGWVMVLAGLVLGPFGSRFVSFLQSVAGGFAISPTTGQVAAEVGT